jgi:hypothetical protein
LLQRLSHLDYITRNQIRQGFDIGTVVLVHRGGAGYEVEFVTLDGETVAVVSLAASQVRPIRQRELAHARALEVFATS